MPLMGPSSGSVILGAIEALSHAFRSATLQPPAKLTLTDAEQGQQLVLAIKQQLGGSVRLPDDAVLPTIDLDGSTWMEAQVRGIVVRWPATMGITSTGQVRWE